MTEVDIEIGGRVGIGGRREIGGCVVVVWSGRVDISGRRRIFVGVLAMVLALGSKLLMLELGIGIVIIVPEESK